MAHITRLDIRKRLARLMGGLYSGTATSSTTTTTITDTTNRIEGNNELIGWYAYIVTDAGGAHAAPEGQERYISDFVQSTSTITVTPAFSAAIGAGDAYILYPYRKQQMDDAITDAMRAAFPKWYKLTRDTATYDTTVNQFYTLPAACEKLLSVGVLSSDNYSVIPLKYWEVKEHAGAPVLYLGEYATAGDDLELIYMSRPDFVTSSGTAVSTAADTDVLNLWYNTSGTQSADENAFVDYLCYNAAVSIWTWKMGSGSQDDSREALNKVQLFREQARKIEVENRMAPPIEMYRGKPWAGRHTAFGA